MSSQKAFQHSGLLLAILILAAVSCSDLSELPGLLATQTPTPTITFTSSPTYTPSPTSTPTPTPSPTPLPTGVSAQAQEDGTTLFIDHDNGYHVLLPTDWVIVFSTQKDLQEAVQSAGGTDPDVSDMAESFKDVDPDTFRLAAMNGDRKYFRASAPTLLTISAITDPMISGMPMAFVTAVIEDTILEGATSTTWDVISNSNHVEVGVVEGSRSFRYPEGLSVDVRELVIAFQVNRKLVIIEVVAPHEYQEEILAPFDDSIDSIKIQVR